MVNKPWVDVWQPQKRNGTASSKADQGKERDEFLLNSRIQLRLLLRKADGCQRFPRQQKINVAELDAHTSRERWRLVGEFRFPAADWLAGRQHSREVRGKRIRRECQISVGMNRRLDLDEK